MSLERISRSQLGRVANAIRTFRLSGAKRINMVTYYSKEIDLYFIISPDGDLAIGSCRESARDIFCLLWDHHDTPTRDDILSIIQEQRYRRLMRIALRREFLAVCHLQLRRLPELIRRLLLLIRVLCTDVVA